MQVRILPERPKLYFDKTSQEKIDKCEIRCANCHRRKTAVQFDWYKNINESLLMMKEKMNLAQELNNIAKISSEAYSSEASEAETKSAYTYLTTRFRTMSSHGHTSAVFKLSESLWQMADLKAAVNMLERNGFIAEWHPNGLNDVLAIHWNM